MGRILHRQNEFIVIEEENNRGVVLINTEGSLKHHGHVRKLKTALMMIKLIKRGVIPKSNYLRHTALRVALNESYKQAILNKIEKDKNKQKFINVNKGVVKK